MSANIQLKSPLNREVFTISRFLKNNHIFYYTFCEKDDANFKFPLKIVFLFQRADAITVIFEVQDSVNAPVSLYFLLTIRPRRLNDLRLLTIFGKRACRRRSAQASNRSCDERSALC